MDVREVCGFEKNFAVLEKVHEILKIENKKRKEEEKKKQNKKLAKKDRKTS